LWDCKDLGELKEYVGCKVDRTNEWIRFTQPVKVQRFVDEFGCKGLHTANKPPATPGSVLECNKEQDTPLTGKKQTKYRSGVGILLRMVRYSRPYCLNRVRELSCFMQGASRECYKALMRVMNFIVATRELSFTFKLDRPNSWDGKRDSRISIIMGKSDSEYTKHCSRKSVNTGITYLEGAIIKQFSKQIPILKIERH
jgi:hypothetical protein